LTAAGRNLAVERHRPLGNDPRAFFAEQLQVRRIQFFGFLLQNSSDDFNARALQLRKAATGYLRKRISHRGDNAFHTGSDHCFCARRRFALVATRFECDVERAATSLLASHF
jgi:hypothetical protein